MPLVLLFFVSKIKLMYNMLRKIFPFSLVLVLSVYLCCPHAQAQSESLYSDRYVSTLRLQSNLSTSLLLIGAISYFVTRPIVRKGWLVFVPLFGDGRKKVVLPEGFNRDHRDSLVAVLRDTLNKYGYQQMTAYRKYTDVFMSKGYDYLFIKFKKKRAKKYKGRMVAKVIFSSYVPTNAPFQLHFRRPPGYERIKEPYKVIAIIERIVTGSSS